MSQNRRGRYHFDGYHSEVVSYKEEGFVMNRQASDIQCTNAEDTISLDGISDYEDSISSID